MSSLETHRTDGNATFRQGRPAHNDSDDVANWIPSFTRDVEQPSSSPKKGSPQGDQFISTTEGGTLDESLHCCICTGRVTIDSQLLGRVWEATWNVGALQLQDTTLNALSAAQRALNHGSSNLSSDCEQNACELADLWPISTGEHPPASVQSRDGEERTPSRDHPMGPTECRRLPRCPAPGTGEGWSFSSLSPCRRHPPNRHRSAPLPTSHRREHESCSWYVSSCGSLMAREHMFYWTNAVRYDSCYEQCSDPLAVLKCSSTWPHAFKCMSSAELHTGARRIMLCVLCRFQSAAGERGHSARCCPLRELECRHTLSEDSPFVLPGRCLNEHCVHLQPCSACGLIGHSRFTLKLDTARWELSAGGRPIHRLHSPRALTRQDFVCQLVSERQVLRLVASAHALALART